MLLYKIIPSVVKCTGWRVSLKPGELCYDSSGKSLGVGEKERG